MKLEMVKVYEYSELSDDSKEKVLSREREMIHDYTGWLDDLKYLFEDMLDEKGIKAYPTDALEFAISLSYCQGDGVGFYGNLDTEELFKEIKGTKEHIPIIMQMINEYNAWGHGFSIQDIISVEINDNNLGSAIMMHITVDIGDAWDCMEYVNEYCDVNNQYSEVAIENERAEFESYLQDWFNDIAGEFERIGYADIEAMESEYNIVENLDGNDIRFLKNGYMIDWAIMSEDDLKHT